jgi:hypothetical protein
MFYGGIEPDPVFHGIKGAWLKAHGARLAGKTNR